MLYFDRIVKEFGQQRLSDLFPNGLTIATKNKIARHTPRPEARHSRFARILRCDIFRFLLHHVKRNLDYKLSLAGFCLHGSSVAGLIREMRMARSISVTGPQLRSVGRSAPDP